MMIIIDNDYMINERAVDVRSILKTRSNSSNIAEIFLKQLSYRVYDYIIRNSINFSNRLEVDCYINKRPEWEEDFKRALAEQALYVLNNGDLTLILPDGSINYSDWQKMRMSPATIDILKNMGLFRTVISDQEIFYDKMDKLFDPYRNM